MSRSRPAGQDTIPAPSLSVPVPRSAGARPALRRPSARLHGPAPGPVPTATSLHRGGYNRYILTTLRPGLVTE